MNFSMNGLGDLGNETRADLKPEPPVGYSCDTAFHSPQFPDSYSVSVWAFSRVSGTIQADGALGGCKNPLMCF